jgi:hypothetical protein
MAIAKKSTTSSVKKTPEKKQLQIPKKKITPKAKTRTKYDWIALKQQFMESDFIDVSPFIRETIQQDPSRNRAIADRVKGWGDEKKKIQQEMKEEALKDFKKNLKQRWENVFDVLDQAHVK